MTNEKTVTQVIGASQKNHSLTLFIIRNMVKFRMGEKINMKKIALLISLCLVLIYNPLYADDKKEEEKKCRPPKDGPAWLQDFSPKQKKAVDVEWESENKS